MRNALTTMVGMAFFLMAACSPKTTGVTNGTNGTGSSGGTCETPGASCTSDNSCCSGTCGLHGTGNCCATTCVGMGTDPCAQPTGCDENTGACTYPVKGTDCGTTCSGNMVRENSCDGAGACTAGNASVCDGGLGCGATDCNPYCTSDGGCAVDYFCSAIDSSGHGSCTPQVLTGPCVEDQQCQSGQCGGLSATVLTGFCCAFKCPHDKYPECVATTCTPETDGGQCVYPPSGTVCDVQNQSCTGDMLSAGQCDGMGNCDMGNFVCPNNFGCNVSASDGCLKICSGDINCAPGAYCVTNGASPNLGKCLLKSGDGGCGGDDQCISGFCGVTTAGTSGNCCVEQCVTNDDPKCAASACNGTTGICEYPDAGTVCGGVAESCANDIQQNPSICDGKGTCPAPGTTPCMPYACGSQACDNTCTDNSTCAAGDFCDVGASACCDAFPKVPFMMVDAVNGKDAACCGYGNSLPCATITYAMGIINDAQTPGVTIQVTVMNMVGNWAPAGEVYPIKLGWGVALQATGIAFLDTSKNANAEIFDIGGYPSDTTGYASIYGGGGPVLIGMNLKNTSQTLDSSAIQVEKGETLYLANATVNGNANTLSTAITVVPGGSLVLGEDQSAAHTGTVTIGNATNQPGYMGWSGIICGAAAATAACTITDVAQANGNSSLVIEDQEQVDIDAEDAASITLTGKPVIGVTPKAGFGGCPQKLDAKNGQAAVLLHGSANVSITNGKVQCIAADGFSLTASASPTAPILTLDSETIQNTENAVVASAGTATISSSTIEYNYNGVTQASNGTIDLSGGGNAVICSSENESVVPNQTVPGVCVFNSTSSALNASNVAWDTSGADGPDLFSCSGPLATMPACTCKIATCIDNAGGDGMDAVYDSTGSVTTTNGSQSMAAEIAGCK